MSTFQHGSDPRLWLLKNRNNDSIPPEFFFMILEEVRSKVKLDVLPRALFQGLEKMATRKEFMSNKEFPRIFGSLICLLTYRNRRLEDAVNTLATAAETHANMLNEYVRDYINLDDKISSDSVVFDGIHALYASHELFPKRAAPGDEIPDVLRMSPEAIMMARIEYSFSSIMSAEYDHNETTTVTYLSSKLFENSKKICFGHHSIDPDIGRFALQLPWTIADNCALDLPFVFVDHGPGSYERSEEVCNTIEFLSVDTEIASKRYRPIDAQREVDNSSRRFLWFNQLPSDKENSAHVCDKEHYLYEYIQQIDEEIRQKKSTRVASCQLISFEFSRTAFPLGGMYWHTAAFHEPAPDISISVHAYESEKPRDEVRNAIAIAQSATKYKEYSLDTVGKCVITDSNYLKITRNIPIVDGPETVLLTLHYRDSDPTQRSKRLEDQKETCKMYDDVNLTRNRLCLIFRELYHAELMLKKAQVHHTQMKLKNARDENAELMLKNAQDQYVLCSSKAEWASVQYDSERIALFKHELLNENEKEARYDNEVTPEKDKENAPPAEGDCSIPIVTL